MADRDAAATQAASGAPRFAAFRNRNFTLLWVGLIVSNAGSWMQIVAQGWLVYDLTHSPLQLGLVGVARAVPMILLPFFGGTLADRVSRMRLLTITQTMNFVSVLPLAFLVAWHVVAVWHIIVFSLVAGIINAFDQPTRQALLPDLVQPEDLTSAIALNAAAWQGSSLLGPAAAGLTIAALGLPAAFFLNAASFLAVIGALCLMRDVPEHTGGRRTGILHAFVAGLAYVRATRFVLTLVLLSAASNLFGRAYQQLLPVFARDILHQGSAGLGYMTAAPGAGVVVAAVLVAAMGDVGRKGLVMLVAMLLFAGTVLGLTTTRSFPVALLLLVGAGITTFIFQTMTMTMLQLYVPAHMRGRVLSLLTITAQGLAPLGALLAGGVAERIGTPASVAITALTVAGCAASAFVAAPAVWRPRVIAPETTSAAPSPA
jgi:MFS family permease